MASPKGIMGLAFDIIDLLVSVLITCPPICRVWRLKQMADIDLARRCQWWLLALLFHSITTIMITAKEFIAMLKDGNQLESIDMEYLHLASLIKLLGASFILIVSIILLSRLVSRYPITQDVLITRLIIGYICTGYLSILLTDFICFEITLLLELILIPITICTHALRFTTQGPLVQCEMMSFIVSLIGVIPGALCLIPLGDETFLEHMLKHLAFKIATLFAAVSRTLDAIAVSCHATREAANYFRSRLQECF